MPFNTLKKNLKKDFAGFRKVKIAVLGDFATQLLCQAVKAYGYEVQIDFEIYEADYNQIELQIKNPNSELYQFKPEFVVVFQTTKKLLHTFHKLPADKKNSFAEETLQNTKLLYQTLVENHPAKVIFTNFLEVDDGVFGNFANKLESSFSFQLRKINYELMRLSQEFKNLFINDLTLPTSRLGESLWIDPKLNVNTDMVFAMDALPVIAKNIADITCSMIGKIKKCVVLDLDNTLWGGVIGDDGMDGIEIGELGIGKAFSDFQMWLKQLAQRGIILAVCSKNTESIAKEPFEKHSEMVLRLDDIAVFVANWENKVDNIHHIQSVLNIGFDSMVFLDDNPFEREMVGKNIPDLLVPNLPQDPTGYLDYLISLNLFETSSISAEDKDRNKLYQQEAKRVDLQKKFKNEEEFLSSLNMKAHAEAFVPHFFPRLAQLSQRSNQFNLRTVRYTEEDIERLAKDPNFVTMSLTLEDQYGDYGLISMIVLENRKTHLFVDTWLMSCRVLKRGVEEFVLNYMVQTAQALKLPVVCGEYIPTAKNAIVKDLYSRLGFKAVDGLWQLDVSGYKSKLNFINVDNRKLSVG